MNNAKVFVVDFCIQQRLQRCKVVVLPLDVWYVSPGNAQHKFYKTARKLYKKYRGKVSKIRTCCITIAIPTNIVSTPLLYVLELRTRLRKG